MNVLHNIGYVATCREHGLQNEIHPIHGAALVWDDNGKIVWVGVEKDLPSVYETSSRTNAQGKLVIPGLIDCHTHLGFAGWRSQEFEMRILGKNYLEIENGGGGIVSTVKKTRASSVEDLKARSLFFLSSMATLGITTIECKSGYGLETQTELKLLRMYKDLRAKQPIDIVPTFLGAHTIPTEYKGDRQGYVELIVTEMLPAVAHEGLAEFCDVFVEDSAFSSAEAREILSAAASLGLRSKLHVDQFKDSEGATLAAELNAISADHLEYTSERGIESMRAKDVIAVMLPLASLYTNQKPANGRAFLDGGIKVAVGTDFNPGSAPSYHLPFALFLACTLNRMTPDEVLKGATIVAAAAISRHTTVGSLEVGKSADFVIIDAESPTEWMYHLRENRCLATFKNGKCIFNSTIHPI